MTYKKKTRRTYKNTQQEYRKKNSKKNIQIKVRRACKETQEEHTKKRKKSIQRKASRTNK